MNFLANITIKMKILILLFFPILGLAFFAINSVNDKSEIVSEMESVQQLAQLAVKVSALVHETQKERGATAGFLGSKGKEFVTELTTQRSDTDQKNADLTGFMNTFNKDEYSNEFNNQLNDALSRLEKIQGIRSKVTAMNIAVGDAIGYYTSMNSAFLDV
ncbi:MAG: nitrate- and nitrite sensing domain-containing protein, partial [Gammaproteobacteria bacterium]|nr:nitrate- and nitrite sensing domain-containing protein [Gammaproteobacteria bacterium]